ncbi:MAG TPA: WXG100 family type VII secretion target, partial [Herpetosiphonaceae bacterium]
MAAPIVQAQYDELEQLAQRLMQQSEQTNELMNQVKQAMRPLEGSWIGDASEAFKSEMGGDVLPAVTRLIELFSASSQATTQIKGILEN